MHPAINFYLGNSSQGCRITPLAAANKMSFPGLDALLCSRRFFRYSNLYINSLCIMAVQLTVCLQNGEASGFSCFLQGSTMSAACRSPRLACMWWPDFGHISHLSLLLQLATKSWVKFRVAHGIYHRAIVHREVLSIPDGLDFLCTRKKIKRFLNV